MYLENRPYAPHKINEGITSIQKRHCHCSTCVLKSSATQLENETNPCVVGLF